MSFKYKGILLTTVRFLFQICRFLADDDIF